MASDDKDALTRSLFSDDYLLERPLLRSIRSEKPVVLLIDEIDKADEEFEAFLLELLSDLQVSIPEVGTIQAKTVPFVVLTSNRARPLSEALRRRCAYLYIQYPDVEKELSILRAKLPHVDDRLCAQVALAVQKLRSNEAILKKPSIAETLDWAAEVFRKLYDLAYEDPEYMHASPHNAQIGRPDEVQAARNPILRYQA